MQKKLLIIFLLLSSIALVNCGGRGSTEKDEEGDPSDEVVIPKLAITLTFPADSSDNGYYDITYTLQNTPKAQGPFTKVAYSKSEASSHELTDISVSGTRNISVKIGDANGVGIFQGQGVISKTSTTVTITLEKISPHDADPSECAAFSAKIKKLTADKIIVDPNASIAIKSDIENTASNDIVYAWSTQKGTVNPTDDQDTTFSAPNSTVQEVVVVTLKIKPKDAGEVSCDDEKISITVRPPTTTPPPPPGDATIQVTVAASKSINGIPTLTPIYPKANFEATVTSAVSPLSYAWFKDATQETSMGTAQNASYTAPADIFTKLQTEHPNELYCLEAKFKLTVMPLNKSSEEKSVWICNQDIEMLGVCDAVAITMKPFDSENITDDAQLTYTISLAINNQNSEVYTPSITEFKSTCGSETCGLLTPIVETVPTAETEEYSWNTTDDSEKNILYNRSREITFSLKYTLLNFECTPVAFDYKVISQNIIPPVGNLVFHSEKILAGQTIPLPNILKDTNANEIDKKCFALYSQAEARTPKQDIDEIDSKFRYGFKVEASGFNDPLVPYFWIGEHSYYYATDKGPAYWWNYMDGSSTPYIKDTLAEESPPINYDFYTLSACFDSSNDSYYVKHEAPVINQSITIDEVTHYAYYLPKDEELVYFLPEEFLIYYTNNILPGDEIGPSTVSTGDNQATTTDNFDFGSLYTLNYMLTPLLDFDEGDYVDESDTWGIRNLSVTINDQNLYLPQVYYSRSGHSEAWWPQDARSSSDYPQLPITEESDDYAGFRAEYSLIGIDKKYTNHIKVFNTTINLLSAEKDSQALLADAQEFDLAKECSILPFINELTMSPNHPGANDPFEDNFTYNYKVSVNNVTSNSLDVNACLQMCVGEDEGGEDRNTYSKDCVDPKVEPDYYSAASVNLLVICSHFYYPEEREPEQVNK